MTNTEIFGINLGELNTIEFQELIPGVKLPALPLLIPGLEKLPMLPGLTIRDPGGAVLAEGYRLPTLEGEKEGGEVLGPGEGSAGAAYYPEERYYPEEMILEETEGAIEPLIPVEMLADEPLELGNRDAVVEMVLAGELEEEELEL